MELFCQTNSPSFSLWCSHIALDSPVTGQKQTITYAALQTKTETLAGILKHDLALGAANCAIQSGTVEAASTLTVIDYSKPSTA